MSEILLSVESQSQHGAAISALVPYIIPLLVAVSSPFGCLLLVQTPPPSDANLVDLYQKRTKKKKKTMKKAELSQETTKKEK